MLTARGFRLAIWCPFATTFLFKFNHIAHTQIGTFLRRSSPWASHRHVCQTKWASYTNKRRVKEAMRAHETWPQETHARTITYTAPHSTHNTLSAEQQSLILINCKQISGQSVNGHLLWLEYILYERALVRVLCRGGAIEQQRARSRSRGLACRRHLRRAV